MGCANVRLFRLSLCLRKGDDISRGGETYREDHSRRSVGNTFYARFENLHMNFKIFGRQPLIEPAVLALRFTFLCSLSVSRTQSLKKKKV